jgi:dipeptidyl aminopeptidase/acylaminoacyl peptidase
VPITPAMVARSHALAEPRLSPDGRLVGWVDTFAARGDVVVAPVDGSRPPLVVTADHPPPAAGSYGGGAFVWAPDGLVVAGADGRLVRLFLDGRPPLVLSRDGRAAAPAVSPDGTRVVFLVERDDACDVAAVPADGSAWPSLVSTGAAWSFDPAWAPDGGEVAWHEWDEPDMPWDGSRIVRRRLRGCAPAGGTTTVAGAGGTTAVGQPRYAADGRLAFVADTGGWMNVWITDPSAQRPHPVLEEPAEHAEPTWGPGQRSFAFSPGSDRVALCRNEGGFGRLVIAPVDGDAAGSPATPVARGWHRGLQWAEGGILAVRSGAVTPPQVVVADPGGNGRRVLARGPVAGFEETGLVEPEPVTWAGDDGAPVYGLLSRPPHSALGPGTLPPLLVAVHGGPTGAEAADWAPRRQYWVGRGWAVLAPNPRGSTGYGRDYRSALDGRWGELDVADVAAGIRHAARAGWADPARAAVIGGSAGGMVVLLICAWHPELVRAGVDLYGVTDLFDLAETTHRFEARYLDRLVGPLPAAAARYRTRSPVTHAEWIRTPLLVLHGNRDKAVPKAQADRLVDSLRRGGAPVEYHVYPGEGHGWARPETLADELARTEAFLRRWVLRRAEAPPGRTP